MEYRSAAPYTHVSQIYDTMMAEVDYRGWCEYLKDLSEDFAFGSTSLYDLSCGTGTFLNLFSAREKYGIDLSASMIKRAKFLYPELHLSVGNMLKPIPRDVDIYLNIHDALNYIKSFDTIIAHIRYMDRILRPGQVYIFDFAMPAVIKEYFNDTGYEDTTPEGISFRRKNSFDAETKRARTDIYISYPGGPSYHEIHIQYIYEFTEIQKLSVEFPSRHFIFLEEFTFERAHDASQRILVIMR